MGELIGVYPACTECGPLGGEEPAYAADLDIANLRALFISNGHCLVNFIPKALQYMGDRLSGNKPRGLCKPAPIDLICESSS